MPKVINFICIVIYDTLNQQVNIKKAGRSGEKKQFISKKQPVKPGE